MTDEPKTEISVQYVTLPLFCQFREDCTGEGWYLEASNVVFSDGSRAVHVLLTAATEVEAEEIYREYRGKMQ